jgi:hypothetical protein
VKFIHLAPKAAVSRILRHGLRTGRGQRGQGVYAVPMMRMPRVSSWEEEESTHRVASELPLSLADLWKHALFTSAGRGRRPIAIVFEPAPDCWPVELFLELPIRHAAQFLASMRAHRAAGVEMGEENAQIVESILASDDHQAEWLVGFEVRAASSRAAGLVLRDHVQSSSGVPARGGEHVEAVFRAPIPPRSIRKVVAMSRPDGKAGVRSQAQEMTRALEGDD